MPGISEGLWQDKTASSLFFSPPHLVPMLRLGKLSRDFSHITWPPYLVTREENEVRKTRKARKGKTKRKGY